MCALLARSIKPSYPSGNHRAQRRRHLGSGRSAHPPPSPSHHADTLQTQLGVSVPFVNLSPALFPDPQAFKPERWEKTLPGDIGNLGSFSRGVRGCIGKQLALAEMTMIIAAVYRRFELEFVEGKYLQKDLKSLFNPYTAKDARVKLRVRED